MPDLNQNQEVTAEEQAVLRRIGQARGYLLVCFWTLPLYIAGLFLLLGDGRDISLLVYVYMGIYAVFAVHLAWQRCPRCREQFFVRTIWLNPVTRRCGHCGLEISQGVRRKI